jgi:hypothetical protein
LPCCPFAFLATANARQLKTVGTAIKQTVGKIKRRKNAHRARATVKLANATLETNEKVVLTLKIKSKNKTDTKVENAK